MLNTQTLMQEELLIITIFIMTPKILRLQSF